MPRYVIAGLIILSSIGAGYYFGTQNAEVQIINRTVHEKGEIQTQIVYRDRIVERTVTKYPDGTVVESDRTTDKDTTEQQSAKTSNDTNSITQIVIPTTTKYSLGLRETFSYSNLFPTTAELRRNIEITGGRRLIGDLWLDVGVQPGNSAFTLGIRFEF